MAVNVLTVGRCRLVLFLVLYLCISLLGINMGLFLTVDKISEKKCKKCDITLQTHTTDTFLFISHTTNVLLFKFRCNIFIGVRIIKEMPGSVASGTFCINFNKQPRNRLKDS